MGVAYFAIASSFFFFVSVSGDSKTSIYWTMSAKLFVGQLPKHINEDQLRPIFQEYGDIVELVILRDRFTQVHKGMLFFVLNAVVMEELMDSLGCAFLTYTTKEAADACIEALHNKYTLPNVCSYTKLVMCLLTTP